VGAAFVDERGAVFEQSLKCGAHGSLVLHVELREVGEGGVVGGDAFVIGLERERPHEELDSREGGFQFSRGHAPESARHPRLAQARRGGR
jgi:hypothetical protein